MAHLTQASAPPADLVRQLSLWDAAAVLVGVVIGVGIFITPSLVARDLGSPGLILAAWTLGGLLTFCGALAFAELGAMFPDTGGQYVYLREAFGPRCAFLCGWTLLLVVLPAQIAAVAVGFSTFLRALVPMSNGQAAACACGSVLFFTAVNYIGVKPGAFVQKLTSGLKMLGIAALIVGVFLAPRVASATAVSAPSAPLSLAALGGAMIACLLSYDGWNMTTMIAGEVTRPQRNLPLALGLGIGVVTLTYLLVNAALLHLLPVSVIASSPRIGSEAAQAAYGSAGGLLVSLTILISISSCLNAAMAAAPRLYFAQARDGLFFKRFAFVHPRFQTPSFSIAALGLISSALTLTGSYEILIGYAVFSGWVFYWLVVFGLMRLRATQPDKPRPFRMWGYPWTAVIFLIAAALFLISSTASSPRMAVTSIAIILAGLPVYALWRRTGTTIG